MLETYAVGPGKPFGLWIAAMIALTSELQFICPARTYARAAAANQDEPVYRYLFDHPLSDTAATPLGAFHGLELIYNFQHMDYLDGYSATIGDRTVERALAQLWTDFAKSGGPGPFEGIEWPVYDVEADPYLRITAPLSAEAGLHSDRCDFWENLLTPAR